MKILQIKEAGGALVDATQRALNAQVDRDPLTVVLLILVIVMIVAGGYAYHSLQKKKDEQTDKLISNLSDSIASMGKTMTLVSESLSKILEKVSK